MSDVWTPNWCLLHLSLLFITQSLHAIVNQDSNYYSERFIELVCRIIKIGKKLQKSFEGRHTYGQLFRSGSSSGANYEESRSAQSDRDFIHKREICLKELRESLFWLRVIKKAELMSLNDEDLIFLLSECNQLIKIIAKGLISKKQNSKIKSRPGY